MGEAPSLLAKLVNIPSFTTVCGDYMMIHGLNECVVYKWNEMDGLDCYMWEYVEILCGNVG